MRPIDADALQEAMKSVTSDPTCPLHIAAEIDQIIDCAPTIEVAPVKKDEPAKSARWVRDYDPYEKDFLCSNCGKSDPAYSTMTGYLSPYCSCCGAKMNGGE